MTAQYTRGMRAPLIYPPNWQAFKVEGLIVGIISTTLTGMKCIFSIDTADEQDVEAGLAMAYKGPGPYNHLSLSRPDKYPSWDEMKNVVYGSYLFLTDRPVHMIVPAKDRPQDYTNVMPNCFHWWQWRGDS